MQCSNDHKLRPRAILDPQTPMFLMLKTPTLQNVISVKNDFHNCVYRFTSDKPGCMLHPYLCNIYWKYFLSPSSFWLLQWNQQRFFLTNLLKIQISYAVCNHFSLTTFFINFFLLSLKRKWQVPSATVNRVTFHKSSMNCLSCSNAAENSSKWFIHQERKTNFCP